MVGREYEHGGIARDGAKMVTAVAVRPGAEVHGVIGGSFGAGNYGDVRPRLRPASALDLAERTDLGDGRRAGGRCAHRHAPAAPRPRATPGRGGAWNHPADVDKYEEEASPYFATARLWDDGIIDPLDTRRVLALGLAAARGRPDPEPRFGVFRM